MAEDTNLYRNITEFLKNNGFNVFFINSEKIAFEFVDPNVLDAYEKFNNLTKGGDYKNAWADLESAQKIYYPKLQPILDALTSFYRNRDTPIEFILFFNNNYLPTLSIGANTLYQELYENKEFFLQKVSFELNELDNFIGQKY